MPVFHYQLSTEPGLSVGIFNGPGSITRITGLPAGVTALPTLPHDFDKDEELTLVVAPTAPLSSSTLTFSVDHAIDTPVSPDDPRPPNWKGPWPPKPVVRMRDSYTIAFEIRAASASFTMTVTPAVLTVEQGQAVKVRMSINRVGATARNPVAPAFNLSGGGLIVAPAPLPTIPADQDSLDFEVRADPAAPAGNQTIHFTATGNVAPPGQATILKTVAQDVPVAVTLFGDFNFNITPALTLYRGAPGVRVDCSLTGTGGWQGKTLTHSALSFPVLPPGVTASDQSGWFRIQADPLVGQSGTFPVTVAVSARPTDGGLTKTHQCTMQLLLKDGFTTAFAPEPYRVVRNGPSVKVTMTVRTIGRYNAPIPVTFKMMPAGFTVTPPSVTLAPGQTTQDFMFTADSAASLGTVAPMGPDCGPDAIGGTMLLFSVVDDFKLTLLPTALTMVAGGPSQTLRVRLDPGPPQAVKVTFSPTAAWVSVTPPSLVFQPGTTEQSVSIGSDSRATLGSNPISVTATSADPNAPVSLQLTASCDLSIKPVRDALRIIHLSDPHFTDSDHTWDVGKPFRPTYYRDTPDNLGRQHLADCLIQNRDRLNANTIVITGDLTDSGCVPDYQIAKAFIGRLQAAGFTVYVVPGNHDYCWEGTLFLEDVFNAAVKIDTTAQYAALVDAVASAVALIPLDPTGSLLAAKLAGDIATAEAALYATLDGVIRSALMTALPGFVPPEELVGTIAALFTVAVTATAIGVHIAISMTDTANNHERRQRFFQYLTPGDTTPYPRTAPLPGGLLILLDSMQAELDEPNRDMLAQGKLGTAQVSRFKDLVAGYQKDRRESGKKLVVCLHHSPFHVATGTVPNGSNFDTDDSGGLDDSAAFLAAFHGDASGKPDQIDCLLYGHTTPDGIFQQPDMRAISDPHRDTQANIDKFTRNYQGTYARWINCENLEHANMATDGFPVTVIDLDYGTRTVHFFTGTEFSLTPVVNRNVPVTYNGTGGMQTISFQQGQVVTLEAGGGVQTGGHGATWRRYVNPAGSGSDRLYFGEIFIPGITPALMPIRDLVAKYGSYDSQHPDKCHLTFVIPNIDAIPAASRYLTLHYLDDGYDDNGYDHHDDGIDDQCKGVGNAYVRLAVGNPWQQ